MLGIVRSAIKPVRQLGLSLVELMVAILISMIVLAGVLQVMFTSKTTFLSQEEMSYIQENARFALDVIGRDIQAAGYLGCASSGAELALVGRVDADAAEFWGPEAVVGFAGSDGTATFPQAYRGQVRTIVGATGGDPIPDSIIVRGAEGVPRDVKAHSGTSIELDSAGGITEGDYLAVVGEDCVSAAVIRVATVGGANIDYSGAICGDAVRSVPGQSLIWTANCVSSTGAGSGSAGYNAGAAVHAYNSSAYFIGTSNSALDQPALKRVRLRDGEAEQVEELALGVEDMEIHYGVDTDGDGAAERYLDASAFAAGAAGGAEWGQVVAVRVSLLFRSQSPSLADAQVQDDLLGNSYNDRYMRQVVTSTYRLRNRI